MRFWVSAERGVVEKTQPVLIEADTETEAIEKFKESLHEFDRRQVDDCPLYSAFDADDIPFQEGIFEVTK